MKFKKREKNTSWNVKIDNPWSRGEIVWRKVTSNSWNKFGILRIFSKINDISYFKGKLCSVLLKSSWWISSFSMRWQRVVRDCFKANIEQISSFLGSISFLWLDNLRVIVSCSISIEIIPLETVLSKGNDFKRGKWIEVRFKKLSFIWSCLKIKSVKALIWSISFDFIWF